METAYQIWQELSKQLEREQNIRRAVTDRYTEICAENPPAFRSVVEVVKADLEYQRGIVEGLYRAQTIAYRAAIAEGSIEYA